MTHNKTVTLILASAAVTAMCAALTADANDRPAQPPAAPLPESPDTADGAILPGPLGLAGVEARLVAPELEPLHIDLPATVVPKWRFIAAADLNNTGIVDAADVLLLLNALGPCPLDDSCPADLNRDGTVDEQDLFLLLERFGEEVDAPSAGRDEAGYIAPAPAGLVLPVPQVLLPDGRTVLRVELRSQNAFGLRLKFSQPEWPEGLEMRVYDPAGTRVFGPYAGPPPAQMHEDGSWWAPSIFGERIGLEFILDEDLDDVVMPVITDVVYYYCDAECHGTPGPTLGCHNDISCFASWKNNDGRGVAVIYWVSGPNSCSRCTGALLNRTPSDGSPVFMTANHCVSTQAAAATIEFFWLYETPTCNGSAPNYNDVPRNDGAIVLKRHTGTDWSLLGMLEPPATNFYLGWSAGSWSSGNSAAGVHHPRGSFKRISFGTSDGSTNNQTFCGPGGTNCFDANVWDIDYFSGTTQPGSSGSPIFDSERRVRGTLCGGTSDCAPVTKYYGRMDQAYTNIRYFLNDTASPTVFVSWAVPGDPGGTNGNSERGTAAFPFKAVHKATFAVRSGETISVAPGAYNEQMTIWRPMTITRTGNSGVVQIGAP